MLEATLLALAAAGLHAAWNLAVKQSADRFLALWTQYLVAGPAYRRTLRLVGITCRRSSTVASRAACHRD